MTIALLVLLLVFLGLALVLILPLKLAAAMMEAKRSGALWCLLALMVAGLLQLLGLLLPVSGTIVALLLAGLSFSLVLGTSYLRGVGVALLHVLFSVALALILMVAGVSILGLIPALALLLGK